MYGRFCVLLLAVTVAAGLTAPAAAQVKLNTSDSMFQPVFLSDPAGAVKKARELIAAGDLEGAIRSLATYVISHPTEDGPMRFLGDLYYRAGKLAKAEYVYHLLIANNPKDKESHNRLGVVYAAENRVDDAIYEFDAALPGTDSVRDLVAMHVRKGDLAAYEAQMERLAGQWPNDADIQSEMGQVLGALHQPSAAIPFFKRALDDDPQSVSAFNGLGLAYLDLHAYQPAEQYFKSCIALTPNNYACNDNLAATYLEARRLSQAVSALDFTYKLSPERPEALVNYGYLADVNGDWKKAVTYYVRAIGVGPYQPEAYVNLGIDYEGNGLYPLAKAALLQGVAAAPHDGRIHYLLGRAYAAQGDTGLAMKEFKAAEKSLDPSIARIAQEESAKLDATTDSTGQQR